MEYKCIKPQTDGIGFRKDKQYFVSAKKSYHEKFKRKINWVIDNYSNIVEALKNEQNMSIDIPEDVMIGVVMMTYYPNYAKFFTDDYPCTFLALFLDDYKTKKCWPYQFVTAKV